MYHKVKVQISNRHVHLTKETYEKLFDEELTKKNDLHQIGQFASNQTLDILTDKYEFKDVRIVGPFRKYDQVEISNNDASIINLQETEMIYNFILLIEFTKHLDSLKLINGILVKQLI